MSDWKEQLQQAYQHISKIKKDTKPSDKTAKDNLENFRGKKGFNDSGIPLTERANKKLQKNRLNYKKYNYSGSRLQFINDARAEAARKHRMGSPQHSERVNKILEIADREIQKLESGKTTFSASLKKKVSQEQQDFSRLHKKNIKDE